MSERRSTKPIPCAHIADFYEREQERHACIAHNLLRRGYRQWASGEIERPVNNLYQWPRGKRAPTPHHRRSP